MPFGAAGGLTAPISMLALRGKTIYNSAGTATLIPSGTSISLSIFENKSFIRPENPIVFTEIYGDSSAIISEAGKKLSSSAADPAGEFFSFVATGGTYIQFFINISFTAVIAVLSY